MSKGVWGNGECGLVVGFFSYSVCGAVSYSGLVVGLWASWGLRERLLM